MGRKEACNGGVAAGIDGTREDRAGWETRARGEGKGGGGDGPLPVLSGTIPLIGEGPAEDHEEGDDVLLIGLTCETTIDPLVC